MTDDRPEVSRNASGGCSHVPTSRANLPIEQFRRTGRGYGDPGHRVHTSPQMSAGRFRRGPLRGDECEQPRKDGVELRGAQPVEPRWFAGSAIVQASPGETVSAHITIPARLFAHWSTEDHAWRVEPDFFTVHAARHADASVLTVGVQPNRSAHIPNPAHPMVEGTDTA